MDFDPHVKHHVMPTKGDAWHLVAYTPRGAHNVCADTEKFLQNCGFPRAKGKKRGTEGKGARPSKKQRNYLTNTIGKLSVLFATLAATASSFICEAVQSEVINDPIVVLELGRWRPPSWTKPCWSRSLGRTTLTPASRITPSTS